ncbi:MAG TPA: DUF6510 family protein [Jatrophihabitans sp.]|jgi:hypothetical protein
MTDRHRDANALAGPLADLFGGDVTAALAECAGCGRRDVIANLHLYDGGPGAVLRCASCQAVVLRYAITPHGTWLDVRGAAVLRL